MAAVINGVISLFLIILVGIYGSKKKIITPEVNKGLTDILLYITQPLFIISSFSFKYDAAIKGSVIKAFYYSFFAFAITIFISYIFLLPAKGDKKRILQFSNVFSNCGFIGFPVINSIYGVEGVIYASIFNLFFSIFLWTYGVMLYTGKMEIKDIKKVLLNPGVVAVYIGFFIMLTGISLPESLSNTIKLVGNTTSPLAMIVVGVTLSRANIKSYIKDWTIYYGTIIKLIVIPIILFLICLVLGDKSKVASTIIIMEAMPAGAMTSIFAENFNKEKEYASVVVFFSTLFSIAAFPLILKLLI